MAVSLVNLLPRAHAHETRSDITASGREPYAAVESALHLLPVGRRRQAMPLRTEVVDDEAIDGEEPLRVSRRLESLHAPLPLAGGLMGVLGAIVEIAVLPMFDTG